MGGDYNSIGCRCDNYICNKERLGMSVRSEATRLGIGRVHYPPSGPRLTILHNEGRRLAVELLKYSCIERKKDMLRRRFGLDN